MSLKISLFVFFIIPITPFHGKKIGNIIKKTIIFGGCWYTTDGKVPQIA